MSVLSLLRQSRKTRRSGEFRIRLALEELEPRLVPTISSIIPPGAPVMVLQDFTGPTLPTNGDGNGYPYQYAYNGGSGPGGAEGGTATISLDSTDAVSGNSLSWNVTSGANFYAQFNPYNYAN